MIYPKILRFLLAIALVAGFSTLAHAQATRTWVSGGGDDANPCSRSAPCKTFAGAISKTAAGGEINVLDPGGFGGVTITKSISIKSDHVEAGVLVSSTNGITVNTPAGGKVLLQGLDIEGLNGSASAPGLNGVKVISNTKVTIQDCSIRNFSQFGVDLEAPANARVFITDSIILGNTLGGFQVLGIAGAPNSGIIDRTTIDNNGAASVKLGAGASFTVSGSVLTGSGVAIDASAGGSTVTSYGNSVIRPAATINTPLPLQ
jgi:parallel beta helix pectate lyase-like protein